MPILAFPGEMTPGTVGPDQPRFGFAEHAPHLDHVVGGNAFGDADDQRQPSVFCLQNGVGGKGRGHEDHRGVGARGGNRLGHGVEDGPALVHGPALARRYSAHYLGPIFGAALGVEGAFLAGDPLHDEPGIFVH